jgi:hypothetical protein
MIDAGLQAVTGVAVVTLGVQVAAGVDWGVYAGSFRAAICRAGVAVVTLGVQVAAAVDDRVHAGAVLTAVARTIVLIIAVQRRPHSATRGRIADLLPIADVPVVTIRVHFTQRGRWTYLVRGWLLLRSRRTPE